MGRHSAHSGTVCLAVTPHTCGCVCGDVGVCMCMALTCSLYTTQARAHTHVLSQTDCYTHVGVSVGLSVCVGLTATGSLTHTHTHAHTHARFGILTCASPRSSSRVHTHAPHVQMYMPTQLLGRSVLCYLGQCLCACVCALSHLSHTACVPHFERGVIRAREDKVRLRTRAHAHTHTHTHTAPASAQCVCLSLHETPC